MVVLWEYWLLVARLKKNFEMPETQILMRKILIFRRLPLYVLFFNKTICGEIKFVSEPVSTHLQLLVTFKVSQTNFGFCSITGI